MRTGCWLDLCSTREEAQNPGIGCSEKVQLDLALRQRPAERLTIATALGSIRLVR